MQRSKGPLESCSLSPGELPQGMMGKPGGRGFLVLPESICRAQLPPGDPLASGYTQGCMGRYHHDGHGRACMWCVVCRVREAHEPCGCVRWWNPGESPSV